MQVAKNPQQVGAYNCGIFAASYAEAFCEHATGQFTITNAGTRKAQVTCGGDNPTFLMKSATWSTEADIGMCRILLRGACLERWLSTAPAESEVGAECALEISEMKQEWLKAEADLKQYTTGLPPQGELWCGPEAWCNRLPCHVHHQEHVKINQRA